MTKLDPPEYFVNNFEDHGFPLPKNVVYFYCQECKDEGKVEEIERAQREQRERKKREEEAREKNRLRNEEIRMRFEKYVMPNFSVEQIDPITLRTLRIYQSIDAASKFLSIDFNSLRKCLFTKNGTAGGFHWRFYSGALVPCEYKFEYMNDNIAIIRLFNTSRG
jgi:hypothetical protein